MLDGEHWLVARLSRPAFEIERLLTRLGAASGSFITAWNPRSEAASPVETATAAAALAAEILACGWRALPHRGVGDDPAWPAEEGWFLLDLDEATATNLAAAYGQNAYVRIERGRVARLVETRWLTGSDRSPI